MNPPSPLSKNQTSLKRAGHLADLLVVVTLAYPFFLFWLSGNQNQVTFLGWLVFVPVAVIGKSAAVGLVANNKLSALQIVLILWVAYLALTAFG